jgi:UDP-N-acetylglucosamine--N-acetylmuramyl-(pentapeptide) pyrophosphoryl-undecaprenol N-acetylglucosamine transferase
MESNTIIFTGGGSGGHVIPALTIITELNKENKIKIHYVGGKNSIEEKLTGENGITFKSISNGKLRRYLSAENLKDIFKVLFGIVQSWFFLIQFDREKTLVFSTGGFVSVPIVIAAALQRKRIYIHEQTTRVGLANKISSKFATKVFASFEESLQFFPPGKSYYSGYPVRPSLFEKTKNQVVLSGVNLDNIKKKIIFITGGGNGSFLLNEFVKNNFSSLSEYFIIHQVGAKYIDEYSSFISDSYLVLGFLGPEMIDILKKSDIILSRSGAGTVSELMALKKKSIFIPLKIAQKNEQYHNAMEAHKKLGSLVIREDELSNFSFLSLIELFSRPYISSENIFQDGTQFLVGEINNYFK